MDLRCHRGILPRYPRAVVDDFRVPALRCLRPRPLATTCLLRRRLGIDLVQRLSDCRDPALRHPVFAQGTNRSGQGYWSVSSLDDVPRSSPASNCIHDASVDFTEGTCTKILSTGLPNWLRRNRAVWYPVRIVQPELPCVPGYRRHHYGAHQLGSYYPGTAH